MPQDLLLRVVELGGAGTDPGPAALVSAAAAFEQLAGRRRGSLAAGVRAALAIYDQVAAMQAQRAQHAQQQEQQQQAPEAAGPLLLERRELGPSGLEPPMLLPKMAPTRPTAA